MYTSESGLSESIFGHEKIVSPYDPPVDQTTVIDLVGDLQGKLDDGSNADIGKYCVWTSTGQAWSTVNVPGSTVSGSYNDLSDKPPEQVKSDWTSISGKSEILNKPTLFSGAYADLSGTPAIPDEQVKSDWTSISGKSEILNKPTLFSGAYTDLSGTPTIPAAQVNADWTATAGIELILNKSTLFSGAYADLSGTPSIPAAQVNADWNASSGPAEILNKPDTHQIFRHISYKQTGLQMLQVSVSYATNHRI